MNTLSVVTWWLCVFIETFIFVTLSTLEHETDMYQVTKITCCIFGGTIGGYLMIQLENVNEKHKAVATLYGMGWLYNICAIWITHRESREQGGIVFWVIVVTFHTFLYLGAGFTRCIRSEDPKRWLFLSWLLNGILFNVILYGVQLLNREQHNLWQAYLFVLSWTLPLLAALSWLRITTMAGLKLVRQTFVLPYRVFIGCVGLICCAIFFTMLMTTQQYMDRIDGSGLIFWNSLIMVIFICWIFILHVVDNEAISFNYNMMLV